MTKGERMNMYKHKVRECVLYVKNEIMKQKQSSLMSGLDCEARPGALCVCVSLNLSMCVCVCLNGDKGYWNSCYFGINQ